MEPITPTALIAEARVRHSKRLSPPFVPVMLESPAFRDLGIDGFDTRFEIVFPGVSGQLPDIPAKPENWYADWIAMPEKPEARCPPTRSATSSRNAELEPSS